MELHGRSFPSPAEGCRAVTRGVRAAGLVRMTGRGAWNLHGRSFPSPAEGCRAVAPGARAAGLVRMTWRGHGGIHRHRIKNEDTR